jgi:hypothetical protein
MPEYPDKFPWGNHFIDRNTGVGIRVEAVTEHWATIIVFQQLSQLQSTYKMPTESYDNGFFTGKYIPLDTGSLVTHPEFRPPADWKKWVDEGLTSRARPPRMTSEEGRDEDEIEADAISADEARREREEAAAREAAAAPQSPQNGPEAKKATKVDMGPEEMEEALTSRLAGR